MNTDLYNTRILDNMTSESVRWMLSRYDNWRASIATRCSIVLSADALLLAGETFLANSILDEMFNIPIWLRIVIIFLIIISMTLLILSLYFSTIGIANVFKSSRDSIAKDTPNRLLFHPSDVVTTSEDFESFIQKYTNLNQEEINRALWSELWSLVNMHHKRYQQLRKSIKLIVLSIPIYLMAIVLIFISSFS